MATKSTMPAAPFSVWKARNAPSRRSRSSGMLLEREQVVVALGHELAALDQELLDELVHAGKPAHDGDVLDERVLGDRLHEIEVGAGRAGGAPVVRPRFGADDQGRNGGDRRRLLAQRRAGR